MKILKIFTTLFFLSILFMSPISRIMAEETEDTSIEIQEEKVDIENKEEKIEDIQKEEDKGTQETLQTGQKAKYSWSTILIAILIPSIFVILIYLIFKFFKF